MRAERAYVEHLRAQGLPIEIQVDAAPDKRVSQTVIALKSGADELQENVPARAGLAMPKFERSPVHLEYESRDFLLRPTTRSWRVEQGSAFLQLALYADLLGEIQGVSPNTSSSSPQEGFYRPGIGPRGLSGVFPYGAHPDAQGAGKRGGECCLTETLPRSRGAL